MLSLNATQLRLLASLCPLSPISGRNESEAYRSAVEEEVIVQLIIRNSNREYNMRQNDEALAVRDMVKAIPVHWQKKIPFRGGKPDKKFLKLFSRRHKDNITFGRALKHE